MFFRIQFLIDFYRILEAKWLPGALQKIEKNEKVAIKVGLAHVCFFGGLLIWVSEGFGEGFEGIFVQFFNGFELDLRVISSDFED